MDKLVRILTGENNRLTELKNLLKEDIWSLDNFEQMNPSEYLENGERLINEIEELILSSSYRLYDEIASESINSLPLINYSVDEKNTAIVIFDGASIREIPLFEKLALETGYDILESDYRYASLPSETQYFIGQHVLPGKKMSPSHLSTRNEFKEKKIRFYYYDAPTRTNQFGPDENLLLWSHFPDGTYKDLSSKFASHFDEMKVLFETVWKNIILNIPKDFRIIITSDHGYVFFGKGLESTYPNNANNILNGNRYRIFGEKEKLPDESNELQILNPERLVMLRGRIKNKIMGPSGNKAYRHGGMSIMEMLTPWLVLRKQ